MIRLSYRADTFDQNFTLLKLIVFASPSDVSFFIVTGWNDKIVALEKTT